VIAERLQSVVNHDVNVKVSSDTGKRKVSEAVTSERASSVRKHSQQFSPCTKLLATKSSRKNLFVVDENEHAREWDAPSDSNPMKTPQPLYLSL
jgi:chromosomal replication initiation ATPase DnaA